MTTLRVGGPARWLADVQTLNGIDQAHRWSAGRGVPMVVLGGGSNVVFADEGIDALVVHLAIRGASFYRAGDDTLVSAGAGEPWDALVAAAVERGLAGLECLSGIPGYVGGTPIQNVGAYGQEVGRVIETVTVFDRERAELRTLAAGECGFAYRMSRFKGADAGRFVVCGVTFRLRPGPATAIYPDVRAELERRQISAPTVADARAIVLAVRRRKGMVLDDADTDTRSVGSFFTNPVIAEAQRERIAAAVGGDVPGHPAGEDRVKVPAAWLIERAGFRRGHVDGAVGISSKHPLAIVNRGGATARDVLRLATQIKRGVADRFDVFLRPEPVFLGFPEQELEYLLATEGPGAKGHGPRAVSGPRP